MAVSKFAGDFWRDHRCRVLPSEGRGELDAGERQYVGEQYCGKRRHRAAMAH